MWVCQGAVIRVLDNKNENILFELDPPNKFSFFKEINEDGSIVIEFFDGFYKEGNLLWLYKINLRKKGLEEIKPYETKS